MDRYDGPLMGLISQICLFERTLKVNCFVLGTNTIYCEGGINYRAISQYKSSFHGHRLFRFDFAVQEGRWMVHMDRLPHISSAGMCKKKVPVSMLRNWSGTCFPTKHVVNNS